jgi:hypothetical protein
VPEALLGKIKSDLLHESDEKLKMVQRPRGSSLVVAATDIENETSIIGKYPVNLPREGQKPLDIPGFRLVPVFLFEMQRVWRRGHNQIYGSGWHPPQQVQVYAPEQK